MGTSELEAFKEYYYIIIFYTHNLIFKRILLGKN